MKTYNPDEINRRILLNMAINKAAEKKTTEFIIDNNEQFQAEVFDLYLIYENIHRKKEFLKKDGHY